MKELLVLNDCPGQTFISEHPDVRVINSEKRFPTLGEKRNATIEAARGEFIAIWDDDDVYLPWRLSFSLSELQRWATDFYRPAEFLAYWGVDELHDNQSVPGWISHPTVLFGRSLWERVDGYPSYDVGEDAGFFARIHEYLDVPFIKYPLRNCDRFMVLRGTSRYQHTSIEGGSEPLDTGPGQFQIVPRPIEDPILREAFCRLRNARNPRA